MSAIYHFSAQIISRSDGRSSIAAAAYRAAEKLIDEKTGLIHDFTKKNGVDHTEILLPSNAPVDFSNRQKLWSAVEKIEKRKDAQLAREINVALPKALSSKQNIELAKNFVNDVFVSRGMIADLAVHDLDSDNPHFHVMLTTREVSNQGFGKKNRDWNDRNLLIEWRKNWADYANQELENHGHNQRIDHRSLHDQGITRTPQVHLGPVRHAMMKKGKQLDSIEPQQNAQLLKQRAEQAAAERIIEANFLARESAIQRELQQIEQSRQNQHDRITALREQIKTTAAAIESRKRANAELRERITAAQPVASKTGFIRDFLAGRRDKQRSTGLREKIKFALERIQKNLKHNRELRKYSDYAEAKINEVRTNITELEERVNQARAVAPPFEQLQEVEQIKREINSWNMKNGRGALARDELNERAIRIYEKRHATSSPAAANVLNELKNDHIDDDYSAHDDYTRPRM